MSNFAYIPQPFVQTNINAVPSFSVPVLPIITPTQNISFLNHGQTQNVKNIFVPITNLNQFNNVMIGNCNIYPQSIHVPQFCAYPYQPPPRPSSMSTVILQPNKTRSFPQRQNIVNKPKKNLNIPRFIKKNDGESKGGNDCRFEYLFAFKQKKQMRENVIFRMNEKNKKQYFECNECGKKYKYLCNLRSHSKVHTNEAYVCEYCQKRFGRKANLNEHRRVHTGELPFQCNFCNKRFRQIHGLKDHQRLKCPAMRS